MAVIGAQLGVPPYVPCNKGCGGHDCVDKFGCPPGVCPNFVLKRHDTKPPFRVSVNDCDGALDLTDPLLVLEANIWAKAKLKTALLATDTVISFADAIGFEQCVAGDILYIDRVRQPEYMLVRSFDEVNLTITVQRGYNGSSASPWKKGTPVKIFRTLSAPGQIVSQYTDITQEDGTVKKNVLTGTFLQYDWQPNDTCLPGCYWLEFKLLKMIAADVGTTTISNVPSVISGISFTNDPCDIGSGVEWVRRFPEASEGFLIKIVATPTAEL